MSTASIQPDTSRPPEAEAIDRLWYQKPVAEPARGWLVYSERLVMATLQGCMADPSRVRRTAGHVFAARCVMALMAVCQAIVMLLSSIPVISWFMETTARTFTRNAAGFFLRACYWKARLRYLGQDTIIDQYVDIWGPDNVSIGSNCHIDTYVRLSAGIRSQGQRGSIDIGNHVHIGPGVHIAGRGGVEIGNMVGISANAHIYSATGVVLIPSDPGQLASMSHAAPHDMQHVLEGPVRVEDYAFVGIMARIMPNVTIGKAAIVHAATEVTRNVPAFANFGGLPRGRQIGWRRPLRPSPMLGKGSGTIQHGAADDA